MAARKKKVLHDEKTKDLIRASQLLNRLTLFANGQCDLSAAQVNAAKIVIGKVIPDMRYVEHGGDDKRPLVFRMEAPWMQQFMQARGQG